MADFIDIYCERLGPGFWAEPLNAVSNIAFFMAAIAAWRLARRESMTGDAGVRTLTLLLVLIGAGSTLFHTLATRLAMLADTTPILVYQIAYIIFYTRRGMKWPVGAVLGLLLLYVGLTVVFGAMPEAWMNGSLGYMPAILFLAGFGLWHVRQSVAEPKLLLAAAGLFLLSLTLRSLDMALCPVIPLGVHFLWHVLNGLVLYMTLRGYILLRRNI